MVLMLVFGVVCISWAPAGGAPAVLPAKMVVAGETVHLSDACLDISALRSGGVPVRSLRHLAGDNPAFSVEWEIPVADDTCVVLPDALGGNSGLYYAWDGASPVDSGRYIIILEGWVADTDGGEARGAGTDLAISNAESPETVCNLDSGRNFTTIQAAIADRDTLPGDTILVLGGVYDETVVIEKSIVLRGTDEGDGLPLIRTAGNEDAMTLAAGGIAFSGFSVTNKDLSHTGRGIVVLSDDNRISDVTVSGYRCGIYLSSSDGNTLSSATVADNENGIELRSSDQNRIESISAVGNLYDGLYLYGSSGNVIEDTVARDNTNGIHLFASSQNTLVDNSAFDNLHDGIFVSVSVENVIKRQTAGGNDCGIYLSASSDNLIAESTLTDNHDGVYVTSIDSIVTDTVFEGNDYGISFYQARDNSIFFNRFSSTENVFAFESTNRWYSPEPQDYYYGGEECSGYLGNHWNTYHGSDGDGDGIGDAPASAGSDEDPFPLVAPPTEYHVVDALLAADFTADTTSGTVPLEVRFSDMSAGDPVAWSWDFGDGETSADQNPVHTFTREGTFDVTLAVSNEYASNRTPWSLQISTLITLSPFPGYNASPMDLDDDGLYEDINANERLDFGDVVEYFHSFEWIKTHQHIPYFDYNFNSRIDFGDVVLLFRQL